MTKRTRTILFIICVILFAVIAPLVVFYSQGYRFDFEIKKIVQTGAFYFKVLPRGVEIYLNGKLIKKTSVLTSSALIENLLPKSYEIQIKKEGYRFWQKNLEIKEKQVTEAKNIILFPENPKLEILIKNVGDFWFSPDGKKIVIYESAAASPPSSNWNLKLYELEKNIKSQLIQEKDIYLRGANLLNLEFSDDSKEIYLNIGMKEQEKNFVLELNKFPPILTERKISSISENVVASQSLNNKIYYLDNSGYVFKTDSSPDLFQKGTELKINTKPFPVQPETEYKLRVFQDYIFLQEKKSLYLYDQDSESFEKFFDGISNLKISPDLNKLVFSSKSEIWILFLKDSDSPFLYQKGDKVFLTRISEKIDNIFWLNSYYLIFNSGSKIKIAEIDDRDGISIIEIAEFESPKIFWNKTDKKLYILSNGNLYSSTPLLPS